MLFIFINIVFEFDKSKIVSRYDKNCGWFFIMMSTQVREIKVLRVLGPDPERQRKEMQRQVRNENRRILYAERKQNAPQKTTTSAPRKRAPRRKIQNVDQFSMQETIDRQAIEIDRLQRTLDEKLLSIQKKIKICNRKDEEIRVFKERLKTKNLSETFNASTQTTIVFTSDRVKKPVRKVTKARYTQTTFDLTPTLNASTQTKFQLEKVTMERCVQTTSDLILTTDAFTQTTKSFDSVDNPSKKVSVEQYVQTTINLTPTLNASAQKISIDSERVEEQDVGEIMEISEMDSIEHGVSETNATHLDHNYADLSNSKKNIKCPKCPYKTYLTNRMKKHREEHCDKKPNKTEMCSICERYFTHSALRSHLNQYTKTGRQFQAKGKHGALSPEYHSEYLKKINKNLKKN